MWHALAGAGGLIVGIIVGIVAGQRRGVIDIHARLGDTDDDTDAE